MDRLDGPGTSEPTAACLNAVPHALSEVISQLLTNERAAKQRFSMVPSEAPTSPLVRLPYLLDASGRYFFPPGADGLGFRSAEKVAWIEEEVAIPLLQKLGQAQYINLRPISGLNAMLVALSALAGDPGATVVSISPDQGGHYATASIVRRLGLQSTFAGGPTPHDLDLDELSRTLRRLHPSLLYIDQGHCLFPFDVASIVEVVRRESPDTFVHVDVSHILGLVLGGVLPGPLECGADSFGGSTHKTFPGPQKGILATNTASVSSAFDAAQFFLISSHHFGSVLSLAFALLEFENCGGASYAQRIPVVAKRFAANLASAGVTPEASERGFTACHQIWLRTAPLGIPAALASDRLAAAGFLVNALPDLPGLPEPALRVGVNEMTYFGVTDQDVNVLADLFLAALTGENPETVAPRVEAVRRSCRSPYQYQSSVAIEVVRQLASQIDQ